MLLNLVIRTPDSIDRAPKSQMIFAYLEYMQDDQAIWKYFDGMDMVRTGHCRSCRHEYARDKRGNMSDLVFERSLLSELFAISHLYTLSGLNQEMPYTVQSAGIFSVP